MTWNEAQLHRWYAIYVGDTDRLPSFLYWFHDCDGLTLGESERVTCSAFHIPSMLIMDWDPIYRATNFAYCTLVDMTGWERFKSEIDDNRDALDWIKIGS
jgi:hypothetical protein